jgi:hypothetical protein
MPSLADQLDQTHGFYQLAGQINWEYFNQEYEKIYWEDFGRTA